MEPLLIKAQPSIVTLKDGSPLLHVPDYLEKLQLRHGLEIPHFLTFASGEVTAIVPTDLELGAGQQLQTEYGMSFMVTEILERRKARGDWRNNPYDTAPDWVKMSIL